MPPKKSDQQVRNLPYVRPELKEKGSVAELTQQTKDFGATDGLFLLNTDTPLTTVS